MCAQQTAGGSRRAAARGAGQGGWRVRGWRGLGRGWGRGTDGKGPAVPSTPPGSHRPEVIRVPSLGLSWPVTGLALENASQATACSSGPDFRRMVAFVAAPRKPCGCDLHRSTAGSALRPRGRKRPQPAPHPGAPAPRLRSLGRRPAVFMIVALACGLRPGRVVPPALRCLRMALAVWGPSRFHVQFRVSRPSSAGKAVGVPPGIAPHPCVVLGGKDV